MQAPLRALTRPIATLVALTMMLMASLMIGGAATAAPSSKCPAYTSIASPATIISRLLSHGAWPW